MTDKHYTTLEIVSLRQQLSASSAEAVAVAKRHGVKTHPRVTDIRRCPCSSQAKAPALMTEQS
jgi:hypothetical protein